jgi:uncharacterized YigZ family protein
MTDTYRTTTGLSEGLFKDKGSKFIAYAQHAKSEKEFMAQLELIKKIHPKARHFCWAYRFGYDGTKYRANDDGEPSGTAGKPILNQIDAFDLTDISIVVVRYFGGTLLGTSGLIEAYRESAADSLKQAQIEERILEDTFQIDFNYTVMPDIMNALKRLNIQVIQQVFTENGQITISIRKTASAQKLIELKALVLKISINEAQGIEDELGDWRIMSNC